MPRHKAFWLLVPLATLALSCTSDPKVKAQRYLENGNKFFAKGKFREASIMYRSALKQDLRFGEAYYRLGLADLKLAAYGDAAQMLVRAVSLQPDNTDASVKLAELYMVAAVQDPQHSAELLKNVKDLAAKLVAKDPHSFDGHRLTGQVDLIQKDIPGALKELAEANDAKPLQPETVLIYVQALEVDGQFAAGEKLAYQVIDKYKTYTPIYDILYYYYMKQNRPDDGERILKLKAANNPKNASYLMELAGHYYLSKRRSDMEAVIQRLSNEKEFPEGHLVAGDFFLFRLREFDRAEEQYNAAIKAFPKDTAVYQKRLVELYASTGRGGEANRLLAGILKENSKDSDAIAMRAALAVTSGDKRQIDNATNDLQALVTKNPSNHILRYTLARALIAKGDLEQARLQLEDAIRLRPDYVVARELLARVQISRGDPGGALKTANDLIAIDRNNLQAHLMRSTSLLGLGQRDEAKQELDLITKNYPQNVDARFQVGYLAWQQKDYPQAERIFADLHSADPKNLRGLIGLVEALASENRMKQAIEEANKAVSAEPERSEVRLVLANLQVRDKQYDPAIQNFQILLNKQSASADLLYRLGETYRLKGDLNSALDAFRRSSQAAPSDTAALLQMGMLMDGAGHPDQAQPVYEQILKIRPDNAVALNNLAFIKAEKGVDLDEALTMAQKALQQRPNAIAFADTLGWVYVRKNVSEEAVKIFADLISKQPSNPTLHYHYAMALLLKGDRPSARRELETAIRNHPSQQETTKIQDVLQKL
jgi:tetratricopeptide (TPR) repeat protein